MIKAFPLALLLALGACNIGTQADRAGFARQCIEKGNDPSSCTDVAYRLYPAEPAAQPQVTK